jgi:hypothetical protein
LHEVDGVIGLHQGLQTIAAIWGEQWGWQRFIWAGPTFEHIPLRY